MTKLFQTFESLALVIHASECINQINILGSIELILYYSFRRTGTDPFSLVSSRDDLTLSVKDLKTCKGSLEIFKCGTLKIISLIDLLILGLN